MTDHSVSTEDTRHPLRRADPGTVLGFALVVATPLITSVLAGSDIVVVYAAALCLATTKPWRPR